MFLSAWRNLVRQVKGNAKGARRSQRQPVETRKSTPLWVEMLEDRTLMSTASIFQWTGADTASTNWNDQLNWTLLSGPGYTSPANYPHSVGDIAQFTGTPATSTVTVATAITVGEIDFGTSSNILIGGTSAILLDNTGFAASAIISAQSVNTGTDTILASISAPNTPLAASVTGGILQLDNNGLPVNSFAAGSTFTAASGGTLSLLAPNNTGTATLIGNVGGTLSVNDGGGGTLANITLNSGTFIYTGANNAATTESAGIINLNSGASTISISPTGPSGTVAFTAAQLTRQTGATVNFTGPVVNGQNVLGTTNDQLLFTTAPSMIGNSSHFHIGILPFAQVNGGDFATYQLNNASDPTLNGIAAFNDYAGSIAGAGPGDVVKELTAEALSGSFSITGLLLGSSTASVALAGNTLTIGSATLNGGGANTLYGGAILNTNVLGGSISGGTLNFAGTGEGVLLNGLVAGGLQANFLNVNGVSHENFNNFANNVLGTFGQINFNQPPVAQRVDPEINYPSNGNGLIGAGGIGQPAAAAPPGVIQPNVAAQWSGYLNVVQGGTYTIYNIETDDDSRLYVDGQLAIFGTWQANAQGGVFSENVNSANNIGGADFATGYDGNVFTASLTLAPGLHTILAQYFNAGGTGGEVLDYQGPDTTSNGVQLVEPIPGAANLTSPGFVANGVINIASLITGANSLTVSGGQVNMYQANTYTGATYLDGATLNVGNNGALGTGTLNLASGSLQASAGVTIANPFTLSNSTVNFIGSNNFTLSGTGVITGADTIIDSSVAQTVITGAISGSGSLNVVQTGSATLNAIQGAGALALTGINSYSGGTTLSSGSLILGANPGAATVTPAGAGTLTLNGGTLLADASARTLTVPVVLNGNVAIVPSGFGGSSSSGSAITFSGPALLQGPTNLNVTGTVTFSGLVSGPGQLGISGQGTVTMSAAGNTYSGGTVLNAGDLGALGTLIVGGSSVVTGGVLTSGPLGTGPVTFGDGTIQASAANVTIANMLNFSDNSNIAFAGTNPLVFANTTTATNFNTLLGQANLLVNTPTTFNEVLSGAGDALTGVNLEILSGTSTLTLQQANNYSGSTIVNGGNLTLSGASGSLTATQSLTIDVGGTVTVDDRIANLNNRLNTSLNLNGGTLSFFGANGAASSENVFTTGVDAGNSTIITTPGAGSGSSVSFGGGFLSRSTGATVSFQTGSAATLLGTGTNQVSFGSTPTLSNNIIPFATVTDSSNYNGGYNLATYGANGVSALPLASYTTTLAGNSGSDATANYLVTSTKTLTASDTVNAVFIVGSSVNLSGSAGVALTVGSGLVSSSGTGDAISVPTLNFAAAEGVVFTNSGADTINGTIAGSNGLTIGGAGNLILPNPSTYTGGQSSIQLINETVLPANATAAPTFELSFDGKTTTALAYNTTTAAIQAALQALSVIGPGNVTVSGVTPIIPGSPIDVVFGGTLAGSVQPVIQVVANGLTTASGAAVPITVLATQIGLSASTFNGPGTLTLATNNAISEGLTVIGGTLVASTSVTLAGATSLGSANNGFGGVAAGSNLTIGNGSPIVFNGGVTLNGPADVINTTNTLSPTIIAGSIGSGVINGSTPGVTAFIKQGAGTLSLTSANSYASLTWIQAGIVNVQNNTALGNSGNQTETVTFPAGQTITGGTFTLSFNGATTSPIPWTVAGNNFSGLNGTVFTNTGAACLQGYIQGAFDTLSTVGQGNSIWTASSGTVTNTALTAAAVFTVVFVNQLAGELLPQITANFSGLTGTGVNMATAITVPGLPAANVAVGTAGLPATLQIQGGDNGLGGLASRLTLSGPGVSINGVAVGAIQNLNGNNTISGAVYLYGPTTIGGNYPLTMNGDISGGGDLTKVGSGTVVLGAVNTYTGATNINAGMVETAIFATALGNSVSPATVASGATLEIGPGADITGKALTLNGSGIGYTDTGSNNANVGGEVQSLGAFYVHPLTEGTTWTGNITLASNTVIDIGYLATYQGSGTAVTNTVTTFPSIISGSISGPGSLTKVGAGELALWSGNSYTGATTINQGIVSLLLSGTLSPSTSVTVNVTGTFTMDNSAVLIPNRFTGSLTLNGGTFSDLGNNVTGVATTESLGTITLNRGASIISSTIGNGGGNTTTLTSAAIIRSAGATVNFLAPAGSLAWGAGNDLLITAGIGLTNGIIPYAIVTTGSVVNLAAYSATAGVAQYSGYVTSLANATPTSNVDLAAGATLSGNLTVNALLIGGAATLNLSAGGNAYTLNVGSGQLVTSGTTTLTGGTINFGTSEGILMGTSATTITSVLAGSSGFTDSSTNTLTLGTASGNGNTYSGTTTLNSGTMLVANISSLSTSQVNLVAGSFGTTVGGGNFAVPNAINFNNSDVTLGNSNALNFVGAITLTGANNLSVVNAAVLSGIIAGSGSLNLVAGNPLVLSNALNTFTGGVILGGQPGNSTSFGSGTLSTNPDLQIEASDTVQNAQQSLTFAGATGGSFTLTFNNVTSAAINYSTVASTLAAAIQSALAGIAQIGGNTLNNSTSNVSVSVSGAGAGATVTFLNTLGGTAQSAITANSSGLTGTTPTLTVNPTLTVGQVLNGPLGTGTFTLFGNGVISGTSGQNDGGLVSVENSNGNPANSLITPVVTLHNPIVMANSDFEVGGSFFNGGGTLNFAGPVTALGTSAIYIVANQAEEFSGQITGDGSLEYFGGGDFTSQLVLTGNNAGWSGGFNFWTNQTLLVGSSTALGTGVINLNQGVIEDSNTPPSTYPGITPAQLALVINNPVAIDSNGAGNTRAIGVTSASLPITLTGPITGGGTFTKFGAGNLIITNVDTHSGGTNIDQGTVTLNGGGSIQQSSGITVNPGGILTLDNTALLNTNRIGDLIPITLAGGTINYMPNSAAATTSSETLGVVTLGVVATGVTTDGGQSNINSTVGSGAGDSTQLNINTLVRNPGSLLNINGVGAAIGSAANQVNIANFTAATGSTVGATPLQVNSYVGGTGTPTIGFILPFVTVTSSTNPGGLDFASVLNNAGPVTVAPFTGYATPVGGLSAANPGDVVKVTANDPLLTTSTVAALLISGDGITIGAAGNPNSINLTVTSGAILATSGGATTSLGDALNPIVNLTVEGQLVSDANAGLTINGQVVDTVTGITIGGTGTLNLAGANSLAGTTTLGSGTLVLNNNAALGAAANVLAIYGGTIQGGSSALPVPIAIPNPINLNMGQGNGTGSNLNYDNFGGSVLFSGANQLNLDGVISGPGGVTVNSGTLEYNGSVANTYNGNTTVNGGVLNLALTVSSVTNFAIPANLYINGSGVVIQTISNNQLGNSTTAATNVFISNGGTLNLGATQTTIKGLSFTNGGSVLMTTGILQFNSGDTIVNNTNGLANTAEIVGGTYALSTGSIRAITVNPSAGVVSFPIQTITFAGTPSAGGFTLTFNGLTTSNIAWSSTASSLASNIASALNGLSTITAVGGVTASASTTASVAVTFANVAPLAVLPAISANGIANNTVETVTLPGNPTGGTFTLNYNGSTTAPIAYTTNVAGTNTTPGTLQNNVQTALNALSSLGAINQVELLNITGAPTGGTFTLTFNGKTTLPINYSTAASTLQANIVNALNLISSINAPGGVATNTANVAVGGTATSAAINFQNALGGAVQPTLGLNASLFNTTQNQLTFTGTITGGTFTLTFNGATSNPVTYSSTATTLASAIQSALAGITLIGGNTTNNSTSNVSVSVSGATATITFLNSLAGAAQPPITATSSLGGTNPGITVDPLLLTLTGTVTGGSFTLTYNNGSPTTAISYSSVASTLANSIQSALSQVAAIGGNALNNSTSNVSVSVTGAVATITFLNTLATTAEPIMTATSSLAGTTPGITVAQQFTPSTAFATIVAGTNVTPDVQQLNFSGTPTGGSFVLGFNGQTTGSISYSSTATSLQSNIQSALNSLITIANANTVVSAGSATNVNVTFQGTFAGQVVPTLTVVSTSFAGGTSPAMFVATTSEAIGAAAASPLVVVTAPTPTAIAVAFQGNLAGSVVPANLGGTGVSSNTVEQLNFAGITGGTFTMSFNGLTTSPITFSATASSLASNIASALNSTLGSGSVTATGTGSPATINVTFTGSFAGANQPLLTVNTGPITGSVETIGFPSGVTGGTFTLVLNGSTTAAIAYSPVAATLQANIQAAFNAVSSLSGNTLVSAASATLVNVTLQGTLGGGVVLSAGSGNGTPAPSVAGVNSVQSITFAGGQTGGTFDLTFNKSTTQTAGPIAYTNNPATLATRIQNALAGLSNIGGDTTNSSTSNVAVSVNSAGTIATVTFQNTLGSQSLNTLGATGTAINAVQTVNFAGATGGTFSLAFNGQTSGAITYTNAGSVQASIQNALNGLSTVGAGNSAVTVSANNAVQTLGFSLGTGTFSGTFTLTFGTQTTGPITYSTTASALQSNIASALGALTNVGAANIAVSSSASAPVITFLSALGLAPQPAITANSANLLTNLVQTLTFSANTATTGSFMLAFGALTTGPISYSATTGTLQSNISSALTALTNINPGNVVVSATSNTSVTVTFVNTLGGAGVGANLLTVASDTLAPAVTITPATTQAGGLTGTALATVADTTLGGVTGAAITFLGALAGAPQNLIVAGGTGSTLLPTATATVAAVNTTTGFTGMTGGTPATASVTSGAAATTAGLVGLLGSSSSIITTALTVTGFGLNPPAGATPTVNVNTVAGGLGGLTGGPNTIVVSTTTTGFGLNGTGAAVSAAVTAAGYYGDFVISAVVASGATAGAGLVKTGAGTLTFAGTAANTFPGQTTVDQGTLLYDMQAANAFANAGTLVINGFAGADQVRVVSNFSQINSGLPVIVNGAPATLDLSGYVAPPGGTAAVQTVGSLNINGGLVSLGSNSLVLAGALVGLPSGGQSARITDTSSSGTLSLPAVENIAAADVGSVVGLNIGAVIVGVGGIQKQGDGTLVLSTSKANNSYTAGTTVNEGTLSLAAAGGDIAIPAATGQTVSLTIGDFAGGPGADVVRLAGANQIATNVGIVINNSGLLDLNGNAQTINGISGGNALTLTGGSVTTGAGTLTIGGEIAGQNNPSNVNPASIAGNLALSSTITVDVLTGNLSTTVNGVTTALPDMTISALISGFGGVGLNKVDTGSLRLTGNNTYGGLTTAGGGTLLVDGTQVNTVETLSFTGTPTGGSFTLTVNGISTAINYSSVASTLQSNIQTALNGLATVGAGNAAVSAASGTSVAITFLPSFAPPIFSTAASLTGGTSPALLFSNTAGVIANGGILAGNGKTGAVTVTSGGVINPGDPASGIGTLTNTNQVGGAATDDLSGGGTMTLQIGGYTTPGTSYDQVILNPAGSLGILKLGGTSTLTLDLNGLTSDGKAAGVILYNGVEGTFTTINTVNNPLNLIPILTYNATSLDISFSGPATHFTVTSSSSTPMAGLPFAITVTALDGQNQPAQSYLGTVQFTTTDPAGKPPVVLSANYTFLPSDNGIHVFSGATLVTAGPQTITAADTATSSISGNFALTVAPGNATHFVVKTNSTTVAAGHLLAFIVTATDQFGNTATGYTGTVNFTSTDPNAILSNSSNLTAGVGSFAALLESVGTTGTQTITATDASSGITGVSNTINVTAGSLSQFGFNTTATSFAPGAAFTLTVTPEDKFGNALTGFNGTVNFTSSDHNATVNGTSVSPSGVNVVFTGGSATLTVALQASSTQTITATDSGVTPTIVSTASFNVSVSTVKTFTVSIPTTSAAGFPFSVIVTAVDQFGNTVTGYTGTVHFTSSDSQAALPTDTTLTNGVGFFGALLRTSGNDTVTVNDTLTPTIAGTSKVDAVTNLGTSHFAVTTTTISTATTGTQFAISVKAEDQFNNVVAGYTGTVHFTSSDAQAVLPANSTLTAGLGTFNVTFKTPGSNTITATDTLTPAFTGTTTVIPTVGLIVSSFTVTSTGFTVVFNKAFNISQINLYDTAGAYGSDDVTLTGPLSPQTSFRGSLMVDPTNTTITFVKTSTFNGINFSPSTGVLAPGTYTATLRSAANGFEDTLGGLLDGTGTGNGPGTSYTTTFVVGATPAVVGIPAFARGPDSKDVINLPNNVANSGIPINISNGIGVTSGQFTLQYNPAYLSITAATVNSGLTGASLSLDASSTAGNAVIDFSTTSALTTSVAHLGSLVGTVPNSAAPFYTLKGLMHFSSVQLSGASGAIAGVGDDAVEVVAYFGDANGDGTFSGGDASTISRVSSGTDNNPATGTIGGFSSFRLSDPAIVGDLNTNGTVDAPDVTLINSFLSGTPRAQLPADNPNGLTIPTNGPDPSLSLPTTLQASPGSTVVVPVTIDTARPDGSSGMTEAILGLKYDPQVFSVSAADVSLGTLPDTTSGWQLSTVVNAQTGEIAIDLYGGSAIQTTAAGSLVTITLHTRETAPVGGTGLTLVNQVNPTGQRDYTTTVEDAQGAFTLHPVAADEAGTAGLVTVNAPVLPQSFVMSSTNAPASAPTSTFGVQDGSSMAASALPLGLVEQVFGSMEQTLVQESAFVQPSAILTPEFNQSGTGSTDQALMQQVGVAQHDWVPADMLAHLGQTAKAGHRSPIEDVLNGTSSGQDESGVEEFFAREAAQRGS